MNRAGIRDCMHFLITFLHSIPNLLPIRFQFSIMTKFLAIRQVTREEDHTGTASVVEYNRAIHVETRSEDLINFNRRGPDLLFLSANFGATSLSIAGANHMIMVEPFWTPGLLEQAISRVDRLGQLLQTWIYQVGMNTADWTRWV